MKKAITISVITIIGLLLAVSIFLSIRSSRIIYNSDNAIGNSAGNLNNGGLFCEYNDKIYFANPYDYNKLYVMNSDCTNAMKLNDDSVASINVCGSYIYYVKNNFKQETIGTIFRGQLFGVYRCDLNGESLKALYDSLSGTIALSGNSLYYQHYSDTTPLAFHKVDIAGKKDTKISDTPYSPACVHNGTIYFSDPAGKHNILSYDTKTDKTSVLYDCNSYLADVENGYAYYIIEDIGEEYEESGNSQSEGIQIVEFSKQLEKESLYQERQVYNEMVKNMYEGLTLSVTVTYEDGTIEIVDVGFKAAEGSDDLEKVSDKVIVYVK